MIEELLNEGLLISQLITERKILKAKLEAVEKELKDACMVVYHLDNNIPVSIQRVEKYCDKHREVDSE